MTVFYPKSRTKCRLHLPRGIWPDTLVSTTEAASILGCSRRTLERYRRLGVGPEPEPVDRYIGRPRYYRVWKLLTWRSSVIGTGPKSYKETMNWFCRHGEYSEPRAMPGTRPDWHPRGEPRWKAKSRVWKKIRCEIARLEMVEKILVSGINSFL